jgi:dynein light chain roadblock-type
MESTFDNSTSVQYADPIKNLGNKAMSSVRDVDPHNEIILLSMQTKNNEFILAPRKYAYALKLNKYFNTFLISCYNIIINNYDQGLDLYVITCFFCDF